MDRLVLSAIAGFVLVVGAMGVVWFLRRRSVSQIDDPSILLAAPPEGMTPAVATVVEGAPVRRAFIAGMIDLASRGEITFVDEGALETGIAIGGADLNDPRIQNNRRRPAGEAETWLLGQLELRAGNPSEAPWDTKLDGANEPFLAQTAEQMLASVLREESESPDAEMSAAAKQMREQGLLAAAKFDPELIERAYEQKTGHAMPEEAKQRWAAMIAKAPEFQPTQPTSPSTNPPERSTRRLYITAKDASTLNTPFMFGTFLETYSRRHGWLDSMPVLTRLRWRIAGGVAAGTGVAFLVLGSNTFSDTWTGLGTGLFLGGLFVIWRAPSMVQPSKAGGLVRAQLAAYRRTLDMTFKQAGSINDAIGPAGLPWLTTPDEAIAWAVALGLSDDVVNVLAKSSPATEPPVSLGRLLHRGAQSGAAQPGGPTSPVQMFEGIQNIGLAMENVPNALRPMRQWLNS